MVKSTLPEDVAQVYSEIKKWSIEAKRERSEYFYTVQEVADIIDGTKSFVIGRKGSGKTSIAQYLNNINEEDVFSEKLSFKNFPFNKIYALQNQTEYTVPNQYISIWKYLIYTYICKNMCSNFNIDEEARNKLEKIYGYHDVNPLNQLLDRWTSTSFGVEILSCGFNLGREKEKNNVQWQDLIEILERFILQYCDEAKYFIIFDELDEDYKSFSTLDEKENYFSMLTSLFKAVQDVRAVFDSAGKKIYPVVFLRTDIYVQITDSDKNKWTEWVVDLAWDTDEIKQMLAHRLCVAFGIDFVEFDVVWQKIFSNQPVRMGNNQSRKMDIFQYIERSTELRPRDYIQYVKECVNTAEKEGEFPISPQTVKAIDDSFSEYLKRETIDELFAVLPDVNEILGLLSTIRKQTFSYEDFASAYQEAVERGELQEQNVKDVLLKLFDAGVIGNLPTMKGKAIFRFNGKSPRFNFKEKMIVHRGLYKALQIF